MKTCRICKESKPFDQFGKYSKSKDGFYIFCKACKNERARAQRSSQPSSQKEYRSAYLKPKYSKESSRERHLRIYYNLSLEQYQALLDKQEGCCAICKKPAEHFKHALAVEHDHHTGEIRGLACGSCNRRIIGRHRDPQIFYNAAKFLEGPYTGLFVPEKYLKGIRRRRKKK